MTNRYEGLASVFPKLKLTPAAALREVLAQGYGLQSLRADMLAGLVVGVVALPLSMALAIATSVPPQYGLYTAMVAGAVCALLGGSRVQVSGPTAAFVVILAPIATKYGLGGLLVATTMAGGLLVIAGIARLGRLIEFIPYPVTTGFTAGIAVVIATLQLKDFFGLELTAQPEHYVDKVAALVRAAPTFHMSDFAIGALTLAILILLPRVTRRIPAPLVALPFAALAAIALHRGFADIEWDVATINSRFSYVVDGVRRQGIPQMPPRPDWPWAFAGPDGRPLDVNWALFQSLAPAAFAIAMLGAIESLLSAVVADGMTGHKHNPDAELIAQGAGNLAAPFFGGFAATGAIARTATNIRSGARSPIAALVHALFVLLAVLLFAPWLGYLPMASMAALLLVVAWNMSETRHFVHVLRVAPRSDVLVLLACFGLTVFFDMVIAVTAGVMLASLLFIRRMADVSGAQLVGAGHAGLRDWPLPPGVLVYEIGGPLFFGAAQKAMSALRTVASGVHTVILDLEAVTMMDATGLVNLESALERLRKARVFVILSDVQDQPMELLRRAGLLDRRDWLAARRTFEDAVALARARHAVANST